MPNGHRSGTVLSHNVHEERNRMARVVKPLYSPRYVPSGREIAVIDTARGTIRVELFGKEAPGTVGNFIELASKGFYDKLNFYGKVDGDVVVGGCPTTRPLSPQQVRMAVREELRGVHPGMKDCGYRIRDEWASNPRNRHEDGTLSLTHRNAQDSGSCQFFFSLSSHPEYDERFVVFGQTIEGLDVVHRLGIGDLITSVHIEGAHELPADDELIVAKDDAQQAAAQTAEDEAITRAEAERGEALSAAERQEVARTARAAIIDDELQDQAASIRALRRVLAKRPVL